MGRRWSIAWVLALAGCLPAGVANNSAATAGTGAGPADAARTFVYAATAAGEIAVFALDAGTGRLRPRGAVALGRAPTGLAAARDGRFLVASTDGGMLSSFRVDRKTGALTLLSRAPSGGAQPAALVADRSGKYVAVANRGSASVSVLPVRPDGSLAPASAFDAELGPRGLAFHPSNEAAFVANFKAGSVAQYSFNTGTGTLTPKSDRPVVLPAGSGPTTLLAHPNGRWLYVVNETAGTIAAHAVEEHVRTLSLLALQIVSPFADGARGKKSALGDVCLGRGGRFLYAVTRAPDGVVTLGIDRQSGDVAVAARTAPQGQGPGAVAIDSSGTFLFVANHGSRTLASFRLDAATGVPAPIGTVPLPAAPVAVQAASPATD
ncbi:MAG TPA: beta-propeller fold lactonase family protein [Polyangia bacterium]|nr:beta-propeller fold lactonase family protein [Polyangia bacterium]